MSKGHCKNPSDLKDFLFGHQLDVNMPHVIKDKNRYWVNLQDEKWSLYSCVEALQKAVFDMREKVQAK